MKRLENKQVFTWAILILAVAFLYSNFIDDGSNIADITGFAVKEKVDVTCTFKGYPVGTNDAYETLSTSLKNGCDIKSGSTTFYCTGTGNQCVKNNLQLERGTWTVTSSVCKSDSIKFEVKRNTKKVTVDFTKCGDMKEKVTCNFISGSSTDKCYYRTELNNWGYCINNGGKCEAIITNKEASEKTPVMWTGCGSYSYTKFDGNNELISLNCNKWKAKCVDKEFRLSLISITGAYLNAERCDNGNWTNYPLSNYTNNLTNISELKNETLYLLNGSQIRDLINKEISKYSTDLKNISNSTFYLVNGSQILQFCSSLNTSKIPTNLTEFNVSIPVVKNSSGAKLIYVEHLEEAVINTGDMFILNNQKNNPNDNTGFTHIVKYSSIDTANAQLKLNDMAGGNKQFTYLSSSNPAYVGTASLVFGGTTYAGWILNKSGNPLVVDLNANGILDNLVSYEGKVNSTAVVSMVENFGKVYPSLKTFTEMNASIIQTISGTTYLNLSTREGKNYFIDIKSSSNETFKYTYKHLYCG